MTLVALLVIVPALTAVLLLANVFLASVNPDAEKLSTYECGYDTVRGQTRAPFTVSYYLVAVLFLAFDCEIFLLFPYVTVASATGSYGYYVVALFFLVLTLGFVVEVASGVLAFTDHRSEITTVALRSPSASTETPARTNAGNGPQV